MLQKNILILALLTFSVSLMLISLVDPPESVVAGPPFENGKRRKNKSGR